MRRISIIAYILFCIGIIYLIIGPPATNLSESAREGIIEAVKEKTEKSSFRITAYSYLRVKVEADGVGGDFTGGEFFKLWWTPFGWKISEYGLYKQ